MKQEYASNGTPVHHSFVFQQVPQAFEYTCRFNQEGCNNACLAVPIYIHTHDSLPTECEIAVHWADQALLEANMI